MIGSTACYRLSIPNNPSLADVVFYAQATLLAPTAPGFFTISDAAMARIGVR
jgi:hypothetical protein